MTKACTRCGKCCTNENFMGSLGATKEDVQRWTRERRWDILQFVAVLGMEGFELQGFGHADLWVDADGREKTRCPFVRKDRNQPTYRCTIYDTRPQVCRDYEPFSGEDNDICEEIEIRDAKKKE